MMTINRRMLLLGLTGIAAITAGIVQEMRLKPTMHPALNTFLDSNFKNIDGTSYAIKHLHGKPLLVNIWAPWCAPCVEELPELSTVFTDLKNKTTINAVQSVQFIGVGLDSVDNLSAFAKKHPVKFPLLMADAVGIDFAKALGNSSGALPFTVLFDADGQVVAQKTGRVKPAEILEWLSKLN